MANKRSSKRRRTNHAVKHQQEEEEEQSAQKVDEDSENLAEKSEKRETKEKSPVIVLAHGAGAPSSSDWMIKYYLGAQDFLLPGLPDCSRLIFSGLFDCLGFLSIVELKARPASHLCCGSNVLTQDLSKCEHDKDEIKIKMDIQKVLAQRWKDMLAKAVNAVEVVTFDYPYIAGGERRAPPKAEKLVDFHCDIVRKTAAKYPGHPLVLAGKSMGSRVSCMVAGEKDITASAVVCLGYPLKGMKGAVRDETLLQLTVPVMFVQGSKDGLCPLEKLEAVRKKMNVVTELHVIEGGDHSFKIAKKHLQLRQEEAENQAVQAIAKFLSSSGRLRVETAAMTLFSASTSSLDGVGSSPPRRRRAYLGGVASISREFKSPWEETKIKCILQIYNQQPFTQKFHHLQGGGDEENHLGDRVYGPSPTIAAYHGIIGDDVCLRHSIEHLVGHIDLAEGCVFEDDIVVKENGFLIWERAHCGDESVESFAPSSDGMFAGSSSAAARRWFLMIWPLEVAKKRSFWVEGRNLWANTLM
ncbi:alpha/beta-Hydrolases superfamily protein [Striga asiatica]|uniref:Alpha/beta-Hydrolases superfamily protein n=1 Tax=Striga asiatica TaxID=4170 RepID=A0A5A7RK91_STRAF|nr:alpha/beta-Hydrolases superfamily protein [Striga asiatica]